MFNYNKIIYKNVTIGKNCSIGPFSIIGRPLDNKKVGDKTIIGNNLLVRSHSIIYENNVIGNNVKISHGVIIRENNRIGDNVTIGNNAEIEPGCIIGNNIVIHSSCFIGELTEIQENVWMGPSCITLTTLHPRCKHKKECNKGPIIGKGAIIGAGAILMPRIRIGENAMIGAGSVVTKNVPANHIVAGIPAKSLKTIKNIKCPLNLKYERDY